MHLLSCPFPMNKCFDALAVLVDCTNLEFALHVCAHLVEHPATRQVELVPDARTVLVHLASIKQAHAFMSALSRPQRRRTYPQANHHNRCNL